MEDKEKVVIEPEIVGESRGPKKKFDSFEDMSGFAKEFAEDEIKGIKNKILVQGFMYLFVFILILVLVLWGIVELLSFILPPIFVTVVVLGIVFILGYPIYWLIKKFK